MKGWLLDTNVVSELVRPRPAARVVEWVSSLPMSLIYLSVLTLGEVRQGLEALRADDPRRERYTRFRNRLETDFAGRILPVDDAVVLRWGELSGRHLQAHGSKPPVIDTLLVATAQRSRLYLATRNIKDVRTLGASAFDPWTDDPLDFPLQL